MTKRASNCLWKLLWVVLSVTSIAIFVLYTCSGIGGNRRLLSTASSNSAQASRTAVERGPTAHLHMLPARATSRKKLKWLRQKWKRMAFKNWSSEPVKLSDVPVWNIESLDDRFGNEPEACRERTGGVLRPYYLLVLVTSALSNFDRRQSIRESWGRDLDHVSNSVDGGAPAWTTVFLVGRPPTDTMDILVSNEAARHGDVLSGDYEDTYRNLTFKVVHGLFHAEQRCKVKYILKTDDDCFVNVPLLVDFLQKYNRRQQRHLYVGSVQYASSVIRAPSSKWYVSVGQFAHDLYPPYASGIGYVVSSDVLPLLLNASSRLYPFPNEDAYVGALMNSLGIEPVNSDRFTLYSHGLQHCNYLYLMVMHRVSSGHQRLLMDRAMNAKVKCPGQKPIMTWS